MDQIDADEFLVGLIGRPLHTLTGRPNRVLGVSGGFVIVATEKSPAGQRVPIEWVQSALDRLVRERSVEINVESVGYRSTFIGAVLSEVPGAIAAQGAIRLAD